MSWSKARITARRLPPNSFNTASTLASVGSGSLDAGRLTSCLQHGTAGVMADLDRRAAKLLYPLANLILNVVVRCVRTDKGKAIANGNSYVRERAALRR